MSEELCPCPFCGGQPRTVTESIDPDDLEFMSIDEIDDPDYLGVTCGNDECVANGWWLSPEEWNTRPIEDALHARIAELEAAQRWHVVKECNDVATPIDVALRKRIAELEAERRWIPVSERLPELGSPILFYDSILERINKGTCTAMNSDNTNLHWFTDDDLFYFGDRSEYVTHWMPLPQPPEVQE